MSTRTLHLSLYNQGQPESGAKVYTYVQGTTTNLTAYTDSDLTTPAANPAIADSQGRITLYLDSTLNYTVRANTSDDATTLFEDDYVALLDGSIYPTLAGANEFTGVNTFSDGDSGVSSAFAVSQIIIENNADVSISLHTPNSNSGYIIFGDPEDSDVGRVRYNHSSNTLSFNTAGTERFSLNGSGWLYCQGAYDVTTAQAANMNIASSGLISRSTSAAKYKTNLEDLNKDFVDRFFDVCAMPETLVWYRSNTDLTEDPEEHSFYGMIADRFVSDFPQLCFFGAPDESGNAEVEGFAYERTAPFLIARILELTERVRSLEGAGASESMLQELEAKQTNLDRAIQENGNARDAVIEGEPETPEQPPEAIADLFETDAHGMEAKRLLKLHTDLTSKLVGNLEMTDAERILQSRLTPHVPWLKSRGAVEVI